MNIDLLIEGVDRPAMISRKASLDRALREREERVFAVKDCFDCELFFLVCGIHEAGEEGGVQTQKTPATIQ
ncbi:hypothetical protein BLNAU_11046 [Blattamonas nauphoetae]|uniref:Uncharacterized protein n=1 Tax=Blattamonas nauphoetae TaxID=2049346 RepID=A0ABQ9XQC9_9EUKA|nr:hypothetical protein BLNAU_11046 [Blattamonas nauphoetae]